MVTGMEARERRRARVLPAGPAPIIATLGEGIRTSGVISIGANSELDAAYVAFVTGNPGWRV